MRIRNATLDDVPLLLGLYRQLEEVNRPARHLPPAPGAEDRILASFRAALGDDDARLLVAESPDGRVVGMALARLDHPSKTSDETVVDLGRVVVDEAWRGRDVGESLVRAAEEFARERGVRYLAAKIFSGNRGAMAFWERIGFEPSFELRLRRIDPGSKGP